MSKSKGNVVDPNDVIDVYGADVLRTYVLFMGDYASATPWNDNSMKGCKRFLDRLADLTDLIRESGGSPKLETAFHKTVKKVSEDIEELKFNTAIAAMMALINEIYEVGSLTREQMMTLTRLLSPFAPHLAEELWENLGGKGLCTLAEWPEWDDAKTVDSTVEVAVQINGKVRGTVELPLNCPREEAVALAKADPRIAAQLEGKTIVKEISVPNKIVNIVVR
ncbi:MAG: class I tRNA ligase family protein, partial [Clostridia bacterium]|nr:class I tRNA ligase family protein [Clostridia bacterium]